LGRGLNYAQGGDGHDTFVFTDETGGAIIQDFDKVGTDMLDFSHVSTIADLHNLISDHVKMVDAGRVLLITYGTSEIALLHVHTSDLNTDNVRF
jgi:hypothetical protein